jgi:hypothetical protein
MSLSHRQRPRFADSDPRRHLRPTKPGAPNTRSPRRSHPRRPKPAPGSSLNRRPVRNPLIRSSSGGKFPIDRHQRRCELPPRFPPSRLFGRLPPCTPSRLCLAGVRKPLTIPDLPALAPERGSFDPKAITVIPCRQTDTSAKVLGCALCRILFSIDLPRRLATPR